MRKLLLSAAVLLGMAAPAIAQTALDQDVTGTGMNQGDLVILLQNMVTDINLIKTQVNNLGDDVILFASLADNDQAINFTSVGSSITFDSSAINTSPLTLSAP